MGKQVDKSETSVQEPGILPQAAGQNEEDIRQARRFGGGLFWGQLGRVIEISLGLAFSVLVIRALGPEDYGVYSVTWSIVGVAVLVASLGLGETLTRFLPGFYLESKHAASSLMRRLLSDRVVTSLAAALVVAAGSEIITNWTHTPEIRPLMGLVATLIVAQGLWEFLSAYYYASLRMRDHAFIRLAGQAASLGLALALFAAFEVNIWVPLVAMLASYLISSALYLLGARQAFRLTQKKFDLRPVKSFGRYVWLTNLATFGLASQVDVLLIATLLSDKSQVSFYNVSVLLLNRLYIILTGWNAVLMPAAAEAQARNGLAGLAASYNSFMKVNLLALVPPFFFVAAWSGPLITAFFDTAYSPAAVLLVVFSLFNLASALVGVNVCNQLLYVADRQRTLLGLRITTGIINILLDIYLIPFMGAAGAVVGTGISNLITHVAELFLLRKITRVSYPTPIAVKLLLSSALAVLPRFFLPDSGWASLIAGAILFCMIFTAGVFILRPFTQADYNVLASALPRLRPVLARLTTIKS